VAQVGRGSTPVPWIDLARILRCDIMAVSPRRLVVGDASVFRPAAESYASGAARIPAFTAAAWDVSKRRACRQVHVPVGRVCRDRSLA
jgi:hypothetical protein